MKSRYFIWLILMAGSISLSAQLSPGKLYSGHKELEGISNCFKCHEIGAKVSDAKCLDCHQEINKRVKQNTGYHSSKEVKSQSCAKCHSDHHGRDFEIIHFDENEFDHSLSGYQLEGGHKALDCRDCHKADLVKDPEVLSRSGTFLGLGNTCVQCHEDVHQGTLSTDCKKCHDQENFSPASKFNHNESDFPLKGKHKIVECRQCHYENKSASENFIQYTDLKHGACTDCHQDVHKGNLGPKCTQCHTENSFNILNRSFDHRQTAFPLEGKHSVINCKECHDLSNQYDKLFSDFENNEAYSCTLCHEDIHENRFGSDCLQCHNQQSFNIEQDPENFDHNLTGFLLEGKHEQVDCKSCHSDKMTDPVAHDQCLDCHLDFHKGEFEDRGNEKDCRFCHGVFGFKPSHFSIEDHSSTRFPLEGAHVATPCIFCHVQEDKWKFSELGTKCTDCHVDIHEGNLRRNFYPEGDCRQCHLPDAWDQIEFDHLKTNFELIGKHQIVECKNCHKADKIDENQTTNVQFNVSSKCASCHDDPHREQFVQDNLETNCANCHESFNWEASLFNHDQTRFLLDGVHVILECRACHFSQSDAKGEYVVYKLNKIACSDCH